MSFPELLKANENYGIYQIWDKTTQNDGYGGYMDVYVPGATFEGVLVLDDSLNAEVAEKQGVTGIYTLTFGKPLHLPWHTVFKRADDSYNTFYRVTSKDEKATPSSTKLDMRIVRAEEYVIPSGGSNG